MPRAEGQKAKLLILKQIFERKTDEEHMLSVPQLLDALEKAGMPAERKSIYSDIDALRRGGVDVELAAAGAVAIIWPAAPLSCLS